MLVIWEIGGLFSSLKVPSAFLPPFFIDPALTAEWHRINSLGDK
jgi:hypothetical protein